MKSTFYEVAGQHTSVGNSVSKMKRSKDDVHLHFTVSDSSQRISSRLRSSEKRKYSRIATSKNIEKSLNTEADCNCSHDIRNKKHLSQSKYSDSFSTHSQHELLNENDIDQEAHFTKRNRLCSLQDSIRSASTSSDKHDQNDISPDGSNDMTNEWAHCAHLFLDKQCRQLFENIDCILTAKHPDRAGQISTSASPQLKTLKKHYLESNKVALWALSDMLKVDFKNPFSKRNFSWKYSCRKSGDKLRDITRRHVEILPLKDVAPYSSTLNDIDEILECMTEIKKSVEDLNQRIDKLGKYVKVIPQLNSGASNERKLNVLRETQICAFSMKCGGNTLDKKMLYANLLLDSHCQVQCAANSTNPSEKIEK